jgi:hypothetical protein
MDLGDEEEIQPRSPRGRGAPLWVLQLVGVAVMVYALWLESHTTYEVPPFVWGLIAALVVPAELLKLLLAKLK